MYLTVQRVASTGAERGINGALYRHDANRDNSMWSAPNIQQIAATKLGRQVAHRTDIRPGGNAVECFLDIAFPDDYSEDELWSALAGFRNRIGPSRADLVDGLAAVSFSQNLGEGAHTLQNYDELSRAAIQLFRSGASLAVESASPLDIIAAVDESGWHFDLTDASKARVRSRDLSPAPVNVPLDVADDFRRIYGDLYPFVVEWVTNRSRDDLARLGGVRVLQNGSILWEWPPTSSGQPHR
jgi:hypothetical protein